jgi:DNA repair protein RadC
MDNGLHGRYLEQLEAWNLARQFSAELIAAFYDKTRSLRGVIQEWMELRNAVFPNLDTIKQMVSNVLFLNGRDSIDQLARQVMGFEGWW